ncbi:transmembrane emp24 domain-containing protein 1a [Takifugu rubripes]|uniref:Transmembrane p24 trafficking protein 1a n=1 Tax=Takifugu rubripes TaxID=31033 RepID=A0A674NUD6_TAKRU|nr:transmembrane emp24 domain-containing protein 1 [Takifugu rubripes]
MMSVSGGLCLLACLIQAVDSTSGLRPNQLMDFTFLLPAGGTECFFQPTLRNNGIEVEYQVIAGSGLDVTFTLVSPSGYNLASDFRRSEGMHIVDSTDEGDYRLCFENKFSKMSEKMVFFKVIVSDADRGQYEWDEWLEEALPDNLLDYKLQEIRESMDSVYLNMERSRQVLSGLRALEARDRYLLEDNLWRVSFWSCINLLVVFAVGVIQIVTVRRLFHCPQHVRT